MPARYPEARCSFALARLVEQQQAAGVRYAQERGQIVHQRRNHRAEHAAGGQAHEHKSPAKPQAHVDLDRAPAAAAEADGGGQAAQVARHQHQVGGRHGDVGALRAHGDADGAGFEC
jgi:hypothetical protein